MYIKGLGSFIFYALLFLLMACATFLVNMLCHLRARLKHNNWEMALDDINMSERQWRHAHRIWKKWMENNPSCDIDDRVSQELLCDAADAFEMHLDVADKYGEAVFGRKQWSRWYDKTIKASVKDERR